jgi:phage terminase large subunit-like protein
MAYPHEGGYYLQGQYWLPSDAIDRALEKDPNHIYQQFKHLPNCHITDGNVTDYASIRRKVSGVHYVDGTQQVDENSLMHTLQLQKIAFDRYNSTQIAINLTDDGVPLVPFGQGFVSMSAPTKQFELLCRQGKIYHDGDPILRWALSNVAIRTDPAGNIKVDKQKSEGKIDPIVAAIMAIGEHMKAKPDEAYELEIISL